MRIVSGKYKGLRLLEPDRLLTRPTSDKVRQAVFNMLEHSILENGFVGLSVLDAFAGSGALGLEALSRGAEKCLFVEKSKSVAQVLLKNIQSTIKNLEEIDVSLVCNDVSKITIKQYFHLVFLDPPFKRTDLYLSVILSLKRQGAADAHTVFYAESDRNIENVLSEAKVAVLLISSRQVGGIFVYFFCLA